MNETLRNPSSDVPEYGQIQPETPKLVSKIPTTVSKPDSNTPHTSQAVTDIAENNSKTPGLVLINDQIYTTCSHFTNQIIHFLCC